MIPFLALVLFPVPQKIKELSPPTLFPNPHPMKFVPSPPEFPTPIAMVPDTSKILFQSPSTLKEVFGVSLSVNVNSAKYSLILSNHTIPDVPWACVVD
jgi:hypothetical protein